MNDYVAIAREIIKRVCQFPGEEGEVYIKSVRGTEIELCEGKVETLSDISIRGAGLRFFSEKRMGFAYTTDFAPQALSNLAEQARSNAQGSEKDEFFSLPEISERVYAEEFFSNDLYDERIGNIPLDEKLEILMKMEKDALAYDRRVKRVNRIVYSDGEYYVFISNSRGTNVGYKATYFSCGLVVVAGNSQGKEIQLGSDFSVKRKFAALPFKKLAENAAERAISLLGARRVRSQNTAVVFSPIASVGFLHLIGRALCADNVQKDKSFFKDKLGKKVAEASLTIVDDGTLSGGMGTAPFDDEGLPAKRKVLIKQGILSSYLYDSYTARKDKVESSGNGFRSSFKSLPSVGYSNLFIENGETPPGELISTTKEGIYVLDTIGMHTADPISGDFSIGVTGLWIKNGKLSFPIHGVTVAGNILDMLGCIDGIGNDIEFYGSLGSPTIRIRNLPVGGE